MHIREFLSADLKAPWLVRGDGPAETQADLLQTSLVVASKLRAFGKVPRVAVACRSVQHFAPALLGALGASATIHLLPNTQRSTLERAAATSDLLLHDAESERGTEHGLFLPELAPAPVVVASSDVGVADEAEVVLSTSGTTGNPSRSVKTAARLLEETKALMPLFQTPLAKCVLSTVPPFHMFGLLFGLLVPLRLGASIVEHSAFFASDISAAISRNGVDTLVSTPSHLSSMLQVAMPKALRVFASGARLPDALYFALMTTHEFRVTDILGSTECGAFAARHRPLDRWKPLAGVSLRTEGEVTTLTSPWCDGGSVELGDLLEVSADGTFVHGGRRDDVVKVAGKRATKGALEDVVRRLPSVRDVAIWQDTQAEGEPRLRYAVVLTGAEPPISKRDIASAIAEEFDPVFVPRQVVFVDALPRSSTGKLPKDALRELFGHASKMPERDIPLALDADARVSCTLSPNLVFFEGHFRGLPILPGTVLLERVVVPAARMKEPDLGIVKGLERIRFMRTVTQNQHLKVAITRRSHERVAFEVSSAGGVVATGVLLFRPRLAVPSQAQT